MYVLIDLEWIENSAGKRSFTQIALTRVNKNWEPLDEFYSRIRPMDSSFHDWSHVAFTGGSPSDFLHARKAFGIMDDIVYWLRPDDILLWWNADAKNILYRFNPDIRRKEVILNRYVYAFLEGQPEARGNAYRIGAARGIPAPGRKHEAWSDVEMIRLLLQKIQFPQELLSKPLPEQTLNGQENEKSALLTLSYLVDLSANKVHKNGCCLLRADVAVKGYHTLIKPIRRGYRPCSCVADEFRQALRERNRDIIERTEYCFIYTPNSDVVHRRDCKLMLNAKTVLGSIEYNYYGDSYRRPCRICNPHPADATRRFINPERMSSNSRCMSPDEQRAVNRHRQAQLERTSYALSGALTQAGKDDLYTLTQPRFAFWAAEGHTTFHLRNCRKMSGLTRLKGFSVYQEAISAGHRPCKYCKPSPKHNVTLSLPIYTKARANDSIHALIRSCQQCGYQYSENQTQFTVETPVGIWRAHTGCPPYSIEHINLTVTPDNRDRFHKQPRLFHSLQDIITYIKRHDESLLSRSESKFA